MDISTLLSGAGQVSTGVREREDTLRRAQEDRLRIQELNRQELLRREQAAAPVPEVGSFGPARQRQTVGVRTPVTAGSSAPVLQSPQVAVLPAQNPTTTAGKVPQAAPPAAKPQMTQAEFLAMSPEQRKAHLQYINDRRGVKSFGYAMGAVPVTAADMLVRGPARGYAMAGEMLANSRFGQAVGLSEPGKPRDFVDETKTTPWGEKMIEGVVDNMTPYTEESYLNTLPATNAPKRRGGSSRARSKNEAGGVAVLGGFAADAESAISNVLRREGGYVDDPDDSGGATNYGITEAVARAAGYTGDMRELPPELAQQIYKSQYWDAIGADNLPPELREVAFDAAVNQGVSFTKSALAQSGGNRDAFIALRKQRYDAIVASNPRKEKFYDGWMNRLGEFVGDMSPIAAAEAAPMGDVRGVGEGGGRGTVQIGRNSTFESGSGGVSLPPSRETSSPAQFYLANPQALGMDLQIAQQQRDEMVRMAGMYQRSGMGQQYTEMRHQIMALDSQMVNLAGIQAVQEMEFANDPLRLSQVLSYAKGMQIDLKPYTDGSFDIIINGKVAHENVPGATIKDQALSLFDPSYRAQKAEMAKESHKGAIDQRLEEVKQTAQMIREIAVERFKGDVTMAVEYMKANSKWDISGPDANGNYVFVAPGGGKPYSWSPESETIKRDGQEIQINSAKPIAGLSFPKGQ